MDYLPYSHVRKHEEKWRRRGLKDVLNESAMESIAERLWLEDAGDHRLSPLPAPHVLSRPNTPDFLQRSSPSANTLFEAVSRCWILEVSV
jgi:hypothetical protein